MRWREGRRSDNVEDLRGARVPGGGMRLGLGGLFAVVVVGWLLGADPIALLQMLAGGAQTVDVREPSPDAGPGAGAPGPPDEAADFVSVVLADTEDTWGEIFS